MMAEQAAAAPPTPTTPTYPAAPPAKPHVIPPPKVGDAAPFSPELNLPRSKPTLIVFLRQCGDPFAEKTFRELAALSDQRRELTCIAVSQAARELTDNWVAEIGGTWEVEVAVDPKRDMYADWGLGLNTSWQMFNPRALYATYALGRDEGIWSTMWGGQKKTSLAKSPPPPADEHEAAAEADAAAPSNPQVTGNSPKGNKWQMGGAFAVDAMGIVRWSHVSKASEDVPDYNPMLEAFGIAPLPTKHSKKSVSPAP